MGKCISNALPRIQEDPTHTNSPRSLQTMRHPHPTQQMKDSLDQNHPAKLQQAQIPAPTRRGQGAEAQQVPGRANGQEGLWVQKDKRLQRTGDTAFHVGWGCDHRTLPRALDQRPLEISRPHSPQQHWGPRVFLEKAEELQNHEEEGGAGTIILTVRGRPRRKDTRLGILWYRNDTETWGPERQSAGPRGRTEDREHRGTRGGGHARTLARAPGTVTHPGRRPRGAG